jgi:hypothetical protein
MLKAYDFKTHSKAYITSRAVDVHPRVRTALQYFTQEKLPGRKKKYMDIPSNIFIFVRISVIVSSVVQ